MPMIVDRPLENLPDGLSWRIPFVAVAHDVLDQAECDALLARIESLGPEAAPITTAAGFVMRPDVRSNDRVIFDEPDLAALIFQRLAGVYPETWAGGERAVGMNERFRCYRYRPGQRFAPHFDGAFARDAAERSEVTVLVYLNGGFSGGETTLCDFDVTVVPAVGRALLFEHAILHEGREVTSGVKYVLRTDVMYRSPRPM
jgi:hypothetical protein